ncbi:MAG: glycoside hydrolase, partial [Thermoanaerobaculia bacterium]
MLAIGIALTAGTPPEAQAGAFPQRLFSELRWRCIGPFRGGRTVGAAGVPGQPNVFYIGVNNGGVWRTNDAGRVWKPIFDGQATQSIGALAVAPSDPNVIYVGSGEGLQRPDLSVGDGIYRSTDAGKSWRHLGLRSAQQIGAILVHPRDPKRLFVAALGHPYGPNEERGVFLSTDGGETFSKSLYKDADTGAIALAFDPRDPETLYATLWASRLGPWENGVFSGPGSGLFRSSDGGTSWRRLERGLPTFAQGLGRIGLAIAPSDPKRLYAAVEAKGDAAGLYRSDDRGESFTKVNGEKRVNGRAADFAEVKVHPKNPDIVYVANTAAYRSDDGGKSFTCIKGAPGGDDYHTIWIDPANPSILLFASDQGATISVNGGETWSSWYNQPTAQLYHVSTDDRFPYWVYGGQQESGSAGVASRGDSGSITGRDWHPVGAEEYGYVAPDPLDSDLVYGGKLTRFRHSTGDVQDVSPAPVPGSGYRFLRTAPVVFSPKDPRILFYAGQVLFKTTSGGARWDVISPDLSREAFDVPANVGVYKTPELEQGLRAKRRGVIYTIAPSPLDVNLIWAGTDDGLIHVTRDGGASWKNVTPASSPVLTAWSKVSLLEASRFDAETAYAAVNRIRLDDLRPHVLRTRDGGKSWSEIVTGLPDSPVNAVREDPVRKGLLYAGTENGVHVSFDDGDSWQPLQLNLPASSVRDLVVHGDDLVVGTHGRSFWILDDLTPLRQLNAEIASAKITLFVPQRATRVRRSKYTDTPVPPEEPAGENPPDGAIVNYHLAEKAAGPVTLELTDATGKLVRRYASTDRPERFDDEPLIIPDFWVRPVRVPSVEAGMHRFVWDLHGPAPAALEHEFPISAIPGNTPRGPIGPAILQGTYTVTLKAGGQTLTQPLVVRMDPRVETSPEDLKSQFDAASRLCAALDRDHAAVTAARSLRTQLSARRAKSGGKAGERLKALAARVGLLLEGDPGTQEPGLEPLNENLVTLLNVVEGADAAPTA